MCGRDGETLPSDMPPHGAWGSAGVGTGVYTFRGQCLFFNSPNDHCCSTKAAWREAGVDTDNNYCQAKYGERKDAWDSKHRSWRLKTSAFTPTEAWPVVSAGRRLREDKHNGEHELTHELFLPNGTRFWAFEDDLADGDALEVDTAELDSGEESGSYSAAGMLSSAQGMLEDAVAALQELWR